MFSFKNWLRKARESQTRQQKRASRGGALKGRLAAPKPALGFESVEDRIVFATRVWDGGGATALWSNAVNWAGDAAPQADDNLVFPAGALRLANVNDFAGGTRFRSITISDPG